MIKVYYGNNVKRDSETTTPGTTIKAFLDSVDFNYSSGVMSLDGSTLNPGDINKTFEEMGVTDKCYLINVVKADNASF